MNKILLLQIWIKITGKYSKIMYNYVSIHCPDEDMITNKPVKPHYDKKLHLDTEPNGSNHHQVDLDWMKEPEDVNTSKPPDYEATQQA